MNTLSPAEIEELKRSLAALLSQLNVQYKLGQSATNTVELDQSKVGRLSRMNAIQQQKMAESSIYNIERRLKKTHIALTKLASSDYGYCDRCAEIIAFARPKNTA